MWVAELWRFPVKSMGGERLERAVVHPDGIVGDRGVHVEDAHGRVMTARNRPRLLGHHATFVSEGGGAVLVDGRPFQSPEVAADVAEAAGPGATLVRYDGVERFDVLPLLVATDGAIAAFGRDGRRLRPNLVIGGVDGLAERNWEGRRLRINDVLIGIQDLRARCVMTTYDPDTQVQDHAVLKDIVRRFGGTLALNCHVLHPGVIALNDPVELL